MAKTLRDIEAQRAAANVEFAAASADEIEAAQIKALKDKAIRDSLTADISKTLVARVGPVFSSLFSS